MRGWHNLKIFLQTYVSAVQEYFWENLELWESKFKHILMVPQTVMILQRNYFFFFCKNPEARSLITPTPSPIDNRWPGGASKTGGSLSSKYSLSYTLK
jgi:hypothetical protein